MYLAHWGLRESPFPGGASGPAFFRSPTHDEALARLHFLAEEHRRLGLLLGGPGTGKSLTLRLFAGECRRRGGVVVQVNLLGIGPHELLALTAQRLGITLVRGESVACLWRAVSDRLHENRCLHVDTLFLFDDADEATHETLEQVARLAQIDNTADARVTLVLAAATQRWQRLGVRLLSWAELKVDLLPWDPADTAQYVGVALRRAGREQPIFDDAALMQLHDLTHGVPRRINQLANLCLVAAAGQDLQFIDAATVEAVSTELGMHELCTARV